MLTRLASFSFRHRWFVLFAWILAVVGATALGASQGGEFANGGRLPGADSEAAYDLLDREFPGDDTHSFSIVFHDDDAAVQPVDIDSYLAEVTGLPGVVSVSSPFEGEPAGVISADGRTVLAGVSFTGDAGVDLQATADQLDVLAKPLRNAGTAVAFDSYWFDTGGVPNSELFGLLAAVVILLIAFGSVVAMGLPLFTAIVGIAIGLAGVELWAAAVDTPDFTVQVASMVGIGVGIDYALFIVTRYRTALRRTGSPHDATVEAIGTAGRAVTFAGCTVVISLMGMFLMRLSFLNGLALGTASAVLVAVFAALTLLPALLGFTGSRLDRLSIHRRHSATTRESGWHRWSRLVQRHPKGFAVGGLVVLLAAGAPTLAMRLAVADAGNGPASSTIRQAYDYVADGFGPGFNGPLIVAVETPDATAAERANVLSSDIAALPGVAVALPATPSESGRAAMITVIPTTSPQNEATERLVRELRDTTIAESGLVAHVGGQTASDVDFSTQMSERLPIFIGAVLLLSFLLLMAVFRSVLVPLKAVVLNLLSIGAAYGVMVAVFQWGWLGSLFGVETGAPIEPWAPMMLFAIVFGLSMDYEVFLLSSVKEQYDETGDNSSAVVEGLASTARVITAAAAIMVCVFGPFVFGEDRSIKLIGLGLATAVFVDATIVRMILVPATMELLGARNWWMPRWLDRVIPKIAVEQAPVHASHVASATAIATAQESVQSRSGELVR
jgi:putative drug exporter of the RND superfamily